MAETPTDRHNCLAREAFLGIARGVIDAGGTDSELMTVLESTILGGLLFAEKGFNVDRRVTIERLEVMTERLFERLAAGGEAQ